MKLQVEVTEFTEFISNLGIKKVQGTSNSLLYHLIIADISFRMVESQIAALVDSAINYQIMLSYLPTPLGCSAINNERRREPAPLDQYSDRHPAYIA